MNDYCIFRILGNELPPRDEEGSRLKTLKHILQNEPDFTDCRKAWLLNTIHDKKYKEEIATLLEDHQQRCYELPFNRSSFLKARTWEERVRYAININGARNRCIDLGKAARFTFVLDGDCFFSPEQWEEATSNISQDPAPRQHYGVQAIRLGTTGSPKGWEPMLAFRNDSDLRFDESLPFSKNDKVELLRRLGYRCEKGSCVPETDACSNVGFVSHISFSSLQVEEDLGTRMTVRQESIDRLLKKLSSIRI